MAYTAFGDGAHARAAQQTGEKINTAGLVAAAVWVVGLAVGVIALAGGHFTVAGVALAQAIAAPWLALAWLSLGRRGSKTAPPNFGRAHSGKSDPFRAIGGACAFPRPGNTPA